MPDKNALRDQLETTRAAYHDLLRSLAPADWPRRSGNPELTVKELMWHVAWAMGYMARVVGKIEGGGGSFRVPAIVEDPARRLAMRWQARRATPEAAARAYDAGHEALLATLDALREEDWSRGALRFGNVRTVEWYMNHPAEHFEEHARDVRAVLAGAASS